MNKTRLVGLGVSAVLMLVSAFSLLGTVSGQFASETQLTFNTVSDTAPAVSPDGTQIAFASDRDGDFEIFVMDGTGSFPTQLTFNTVIDTLPEFSPDGTKIAFSSTRDGDFEIFVMNRDGSSQTQLTFNTAIDFQPDFSPDGSKIAFTSNRNGNSEIYVMNADGSSPARITVNQAVDQFPEFSPDGTQIAFESNRDGDEEIFVMNRDGSSQMQLTFNAAFDQGPDFSPDGARISFASDRDGFDREIFVMNRDGSSPTQLTFNTATDLGPDFSPDGTAITFASDRDGDLEIFVGRVGGTPVTPATLTLSPATATNPVGTDHTVTATLEDATGNPVAAVVVRFTVIGTEFNSGSCTTDANGKCSFTYTGPPLPGADSITAYADTNNNDAQDVGEPSGAATKTWVVPASTPGCEVIIADNGKIIAANGDTATFRGHAKVSSSGQDVTGEQRYHDLGPAQPLTVESINVLAVVCSTDRTEATIFGRATVDGSGITDYRIRVKDLGEPGKNKDMYGILLRNGYFSGDQTLTAGNVQITVQM